MKNRKLVRLIAVILAAVLALSLLVTVISYVASGASPESELEQLRQDAETLRRKEEEAEARINAIEHEQLRVLEKKEVLDHRVVITEEVISNCEKQLEACDLVQEELEGRLEEAQRVRAEKLSALGDRVRSTEENGVISYFSMLFRASSFFDLLSRFDFLQQMLQHDEQVYAEYLKAKMDEERIRSDLEALNAAREEIRTAEAEARASLLDQEAYAASAFAADMAVAEKYIQACMDAESEQDQLDKDISSSDVEYTRVTQRSVRRGTGTFAAPLKGGLTVLEPFGSLLNEEFQYYRMHTGADLKSDYGADVLAADDGTVTRTGYTLAMGNYVVIAHGSTYKTVYAHLGHVDTEVGDEVLQGDVIGTVGSTGAASVAMLHFELRYENTAVNPMRYLAHEEPAA